MTPPPPPQPPSHPTSSKWSANPQRRRCCGRRRDAASAASEPRRLMDIVLGVVGRLRNHNVGVSMLDIEFGSVNEGFLPDRTGTRELLRYGVARAVREGRLQQTSGGLYRIPGGTSRSRSRTCSPLQRRAHRCQADSHCPTSSVPKRWFRRPSSTPPPPETTMCSYRHRDRMSRKSPPHGHPLPSSHSRTSNLPVIYARDEIPSFALKEAVLGSMGVNVLADVDDFDENADGSDVDGGSGGGRRGSGGAGGLAKRAWGRRGGGSRHSMRRSDENDLSDDEGHFEARPQRRRGDEGSPDALPKMERRRDGDHGRAAAAALFILASDIIKVIAQRASNKLNSLSFETRLGGGVGGGGTVIGGCEGGGGPGSGGGGLGDGRSGEGGAYGGPDFDYCSTQEGPSPANGSEDSPMDAAASGTLEPDVEEAGRVVLQGAGALSEISTYLGQGAANVLNVSADGHTESEEKKEAIFKAFQVTAMDIVRVARVFVHPETEKNDGDAEGQSPFLSPPPREESLGFNGEPRSSNGCQENDATRDETTLEPRDADVTYSLPGTSSTLAINIRAENNRGEINTNMEVFIRNLMHDVRLLARRVSSCISSH